MSPKTPHCDFFAWNIKLHVVFLIFEKQIKTYCFKISALGQKFQNFFLIRNRVRISE